MLGGPPRRQRITEPANALRSSMLRSPLLLAALVLDGCANFAPDDEHGIVDRSQLHLTTSTAAKGDLEAELSLGAQPSDLAFGQITVNYGVTDAIELSLDVFPWQAARRNGVTDSGLGDTLLTATGRIAEETDERPSVALQLGYTLPTGENDLPLSTTGIEAFGGAIATRHFEHFQGSAYGLLVGLEGNGNESAAASGLFGLVAGTSVHEGVALIGELQYQTIPQRSSDTVGATAALLLVPWQPLQVRLGGRTLILLGQDSFEGFVSATLYL